MIQPEEDKKEEWVRIEGVSEKRSITYSGMWMQCRAQRLKAGALVLFGEYQFG